MGYRIDDNGYACAECGARVWSREEAEDCQRAHGEAARPYATALDARVTRLRTALRLASERWRGWRSAWSSIGAREADGSLRANGTPENPQPWRECDQAAYDRCERWNDWRLKLQARLSRAKAHRSAAWDRIAFAEGR